MMRTVNRKCGGGGGGGQQPGRLAATTTKFRTDTRPKKLKYLQRMLCFSEQQPLARGAPGSVLGQDAGCFCVPEER